MTSLSSAPNPLVTVIVFAYNQQRVVRDAILSAFAQTYSPLEIILSDDCSTDNTFKIMQEMTAAYTGRHSIILNRNARNLGIVRHLDKVYRMAHGKLLINAPGDDISLPERSTRLVNAWLAQSVRPSLVFSNAMVLDGAETEPRLLVDPQIRGFCRKLANPFEESLILGCTAAIDKSLVEFFDPIAEQFMGEDSLSFRRAHLINGVCYLADGLVKYRRGVVGASGGISALKERGRRSAIAFHLFWAKDRLARLKVHRSDIDKARPPNQAFLLARVCAQEREAKYLVKVLEGHFGTSTAALLSSVLGANAGTDTVRECLKQYLLRWVPVTYRFMST